MQLVGNVHVVAGGPEIVPFVQDFLKAKGILTKGNPDAYVRTYKQFGVEEARSLRSRASLKALGDPSKGLGAGRRIFILAAADINREAQNALLKIFEEESGGALFILIVPSPHTLLPTLRSRMQVLALNRAPPRESGIDTEKFLSASPQKRLDLLKPLLEKGEDDRRDLAAILSFLSALEERLAKHPKALPAARGEGLEAVYRARKYITDRGALVKPLLEQVALLVPRV